MLFFVAAWADRDEPFDRLATDVHLRIPLVMDLRSRLTTIYAPVAVPLQHKPAFPLPEGCGQYVFSVVFFPLLTLLRKEQIIYHPFEANENAYKYRDARHVHLQGPTLIDPGKSGNEYGVP
jgi:hypothetical protein